MRGVLPLLVLFAVFSVSYTQRGRCYHRYLPKNRGLVLNDGFTLNGEYMNAKCSDGFTVVRGSKPLCSKGNWIQDVSPCKENSCEYEPPLIDNGRSESGSKDHNSTVTYECEEGFVLKEPKSSPIRCLYGEWKGTPPTCGDKYCSTPRIANADFHQRNIEQKSLQESYTPAALNRLHEHGAKLYVVCEGQYTFYGNGLVAAEVECSEGKWIPEPKCLKTDVIIRSSKPSRSKIDLIEGEPFEIHCDSYYRISWDVSKVKGLRVVDGSKWVGGLYLNRKTLRLYPATQQHSRVYNCGINGTKQRSIEIKVTGKLVTGCGQPSTDPLQPFVVGGVNAQENSWPWMVSVYKFGEATGKYYFRCGGSVLSPTHVLSAAHCFIQRGGKWAVRWGSVYMTSPVSLDDEGVLEVINVHTFEQYDPRKHYSDIAVLLVKGRMDTIPVCLPRPHHDLEGQLNATVTGWGRTSYVGRLSPHLKEAKLQVVDQKICKRNYAVIPSTALDRGISDTMICAAAEGKDACQSDSGGPLVTLVEGGRWVQIGVVAVGNKCAEPDFPGVYTRVTSFVEWIRRAAGLPSYH